MLRQHSKTPSAQAKDRIQALLREISILRDGGCFLRNTTELGSCGSKPTKDGHIILQFDHLITRARNISYGESRLGVCVCERHHYYHSVRMKYDHPELFEKYEELAREHIGPDNAALWDKVKADRKTYTFTTYDWLKIEAALAHELKLLKHSATYLSESVA
jgi:hypothetical protein